MTKEEVKQILQIPSDDTSQDEYIETMLPMLVEFVQAECNNDFTDEEGEVQLPGPLKVAIAKMIEYNTRSSGVASKSLGRKSVSYSLDFPDSILRLLRPYKRVRFI